MEKSILNLPDDVLAEIFQRLDIRSRGRCESVCRRFRDVAVISYRSYPWKGVPNREMTLVLAAWCHWKEVFEDEDNIEIDSNQMRIAIVDKCLRLDNWSLGPDNVKRSQRQFAPILASILEKFVDYSAIVEIHNAELNTDAISTLIEYQAKIGQLIFKHCTFANAKATKAAQFFALYGKKLAVEKRCSCRERWPYS